MSDLDTPNRDLSLLAPAFRRAVEAAIQDCRDKGFPVKVNEGFRSQARQNWLYRQGRSRPGRIVTNAPTSLTSWHGYGLAVDVIHAT
jgi:LAS superfamily LD-carboxypeptidase LdcB